MLRIYQSNKQLINQHQKQNKMNTKTQKIIQWTMAGIVGFIYIGSGLSKLAGGEEAGKMAMGMGLSMETFQMLGILEIVGALLFLFPRTGIIGTLFLAAYMGGAMSIHLAKDLALTAPAMIEAITWVAAFVRFPELKNRLLGMTEAPATR